MKKFYYTVLALALSIYTMNAQSISIKEALDIAKKYGNIDIQKNSLRGLDNEKKDYYSFDKKNGGFVIIAGDKQMPELIGFSNEGKFPQGKDMPDPLKMILENYKERLEQVRENPYKNNIQNKLRSFNSKGYKIVGPLIKTKWNQTYPYNLKMPTYFDVDTKKEEHVVVGCVPLAYATVMHYYKWPDRGYGEKIWMAPTGPNGVTLPDIKMYANFGETTYHFDKMKNTYKGEFDTDNTTIDTKEEIDAVAQFLHDVGVAGEVGFGSVGTVAEWRPNYYAPYFRYYLGEESLFNFKTWGDNIKFFIEKIKKNIDNGDPMIFIGGQHAWVVDGYDSNDFLHCNWGWGGGGNGYFDYNYMDTSKGGLNSYMQNGEQGGFRCCTIHPNKGVYDTEEEITKAFKLNESHSYIETENNELYIKGDFDVANNTNKDLNVSLGVVFERNRHLIDTMYIVNQYTFKAHETREEVKIDDLPINNLLKENMVDGNYRFWFVYKINNGKTLKIKNGTTLGCNIKNGMAEEIRKDDDYKYFNIKILSSLDELKNIQTDRYYRYISQIEMDNGEYGKKELWLESNDYHVGVYLHLENETKKYNIKIGRLRSIYNFSKQIIKYDFILNSKSIETGVYDGKIVIDNNYYIKFHKEFNIPGKVTVTSLVSSNDPVKNIYTTDLSLSTPRKIPIEGETINKEFMNPISRNLQIKSGDKVSLNFILLTIGDKKKVHYDGVEMTLSNKEHTYRFYTKKGIFGRVVTDKPTSNERANYDAIDVPNGTYKVSVRLYKEVNGNKEFIDIQKGLYDDYSLTVCDNPDNSYHIEYPGYKPEYSIPTSIEDITNIVDLTKKDDKKDDEGNKTAIDNVKDDNINIRILNRNINIDSNLPINRLSIYNINGILVKDISSSNITEMSIIDLEKGVYIIKACNNNNKTKTMKFVIN